MKMNSFKNLVLLIALMTLSACSSQGSKTPTPVGILSMGKLYRVNSCAEVESYIKDYAALRSSYNEFSGIGGANPASEEGDSQNNGEEPAADPQVTQSDIAFSDPSRHLLYVTKKTYQGGLLKIFAAKLEDSQELASLEINFTPRELITMQETKTNTQLLVIFGQSLNSLNGITAVYKVDDPSQIQEVFRYRYQGEFQEARSIQGEENAALVWSANDFFSSQETPEPKTLFPSTFTTNSEGETREQTLSDCSNHLVYQNQEDERSYSWIKRSQLFYMNLSELNFEVSSQSILSPAGDNFIHVNPDHVFLVEQSYLNDAELYQFDLPKHQEIGENFQLSAFAEIPGYIKDQFFLDEYQGILNVFHRVSSNVCIDFCNEPVLEKTSNLETGSYFSSYQQSGNQFINVGRIGPFAAGEETYSARFVGPWAYVITFRQVDPLFVIDRRDSSKPKLLDEFKIDEVSYHLQAVPSLNENQLLLGIGGLPNQGSIVANLFSIDTDGKVSLADQLTIENDGAYSLGFHDYRALTYDQAGLSFALPYNDYSDMISKLAVFSIDPETESFQDLNKIEKNFEYAETGSSEIKRAFFFDQVLTPVSEIDVAIHDLSNLEELYHFDL
ncbi:MAG: beta-propeller domain-containing protein [Deltaproteobacteria bacterium]|nr:beta-propeller domain-containing protein [Deltaproteobacteria bacterium]